nr:ATP synthase subunit s, mitochondrial-like [Procambarus clarkii]
MQRWPTSVMNYRYLKSLQPLAAFLPTGRTNFYDKSLQSPKCNFGLVTTDGRHPATLYGECLSLTVPQVWSHTSQRSLWAWLNAIFNKVDESRVKEVGPDRACAEWLLRCGAVVKWHSSGKWTKDYNTLPPTGGSLLKIEEIDATDSAVMHIGFPHFKGCKHIRRIVFHKASYLDDAGLSQLPLLCNSLKELQISSCGNVTADGLRHLGKLKNLEHLLLYDLPEITNKDAILQELEEALPKCTIVFPYALAKDDPSLKTKE